MQPLAVGPSMLGRKRSTRLWSIGSILDLTKGLKVHRFRVGSITFTIRFPAVIELPDLLKNTNTRRKFQRSIAGQISKRKKKYRVLVKRFITKYNKRIEHASFDRWVQQVEEKKRTRTLLARFTKRWQNLEMLAIFRGWSHFVKTQKDEREADLIWKKKVTRAMLKWKRFELGVVFKGWHANVSKIRRERALVDVSFLNFIRELSTLCCQMDRIYSREDL